MSSQAITPTVRRDFRSVAEGWLETVNRGPRLWLTIFALLLVAQIRPWWLPEQDGHHYLSIARSLALEGHLRNLGSTHLWYFPGYPMIISPLFWISERPLWFLSAFHWLAAIGFMIGVYWWAKSVIPQWAVWIAGLSVINEGVWIHCARSLTEIPFMCGLIWSANAALAAARSRTAGETMFRGTLASALLALTALIRPAGILLAVGLGLHLGWKALQKDVSWTRAVALTLLFGIPGSLAVLTAIRSEQANAAAENGKTYLNNFHEKAAVPTVAYGEGIRLAIRDSGRVIIPGMFKAYQDAGWRDLTLLVYLPVCGVLAFGWWRLVRESVDPLLLAVPFYVLLHVAWSFEVGARFFVPLLPIFMASLARLLVSMRRGQLLTMGGILSAHLTIALVYWLAVDAPRGQALTAHWNELEQLAQPIDIGRDCVSAWKMNLDDVLVMELALDRPVALYETKRDQRDQMRPEAEWIVSGRNSSDVPGFTLASETESFRLLRRTTVTAANDASSARVR